MSGKPEYAKKYPCPHCDVMKHGTAQLLAHIRDKHTEKAVVKSAPASKPLLNPLGVMVGVAVTVVYQICEDASKGTTYMVEHGIIALALILMMQMLAAQIVRRIR